MYAARLVGLSVILSRVVFTDDQNKPRGERITTVFTREGENATLPCPLDPLNPKFHAFDWKKGSQEVFMYQPGKLDYTTGLKGQDPKFEGRVRLAPGGLQAGKASVILFNVTEEDIGLYKCILLPQERISWIHLKMVVDPQLTLTIEEAPLSAGWARLSCVSTGGHPQPRGLEWMNQDGAVKNSTNSTHSRGHYHLHLIVKEPGNYTCLALRGDVKPASRAIQLFGNWQTSAGNFECGILGFILFLVVVCIIIGFTYNYFKPNPCGIHLRSNRDRLESITTEDPDLNVKE